MLTMTLSPDLEAKEAAFGPDAIDADGGCALNKRLRAAAPRLLQAREHLFFEGDHKDCIYQVERGAVCLYKTLPDGRRQIVDFAYPGDFIGLGSPEEHVFSAQAITLTRLRCLSASLLDEVARHDPQVCMMLYRALSDQLFAARDLLLTVGQRSATERLAAFLMALSRRNERNFVDPMRIVLPMTRADIADFLSLTIETVSRSFTKLRQSGIIDLMQSSFVIVRNRQTLEQLAAGEAREFK